MAVDRVPFTKNVGHMPFGKKSGSSFDFIQQSFDNVTLAFGVGGFQESWIRKKTFERRSNFGIRFDNLRVLIQTCCIQIYKP